MKVWVISRAEEDLFAVLGVYASEKARDEAIEFWAKKIYPWDESFPNSWSRNWEFFLDVDEFELEGLSGETRA